MLAFGQLTTIIKSEIAQFWEGVNVSNEKLTLDGDQIIMLYVYIAGKAKINNLFAHLQFCKEFSTPFIKTTRIGYCLTTMEVALQLLTDEDDLIQPEEIKEQEQEAI